MNNDERKISDYIDKLNREQKPDEHDVRTDSDELEKLCAAARKVRSLREPAMPEADFPKKLARTVTDKLNTIDIAGKRKRIWYRSAASIAAILVIAFMVNLFVDNRETNIVYAMEEAFIGIDAYHGILEVLETNEDGDKSIQSKLEVWADKEGHYYIKGLEGAQKDIITVNNGQNKWQLKPSEKQVHVFPSFPDAYHFVFELGHEIDNISNSLSANVVGRDEIAGRDATIIEVTPQGGESYRIWIDKDTKLPLQKQSGMHKALQYTVTYTELNFTEKIPAELLNYQVPEGYIEIIENAEQVVNNIAEAEEAAGLTVRIPLNTELYGIDRIAIVPAKNTVKLYYSISKNNTIIFIQGKADSEFKPAPTAVIGNINGSIAEIQSPVYESSGILGGGGLYAGVTDLSSIRWQESGIEYAAVGNVTLEDLITFTNNATGETLQIPQQGENSAIRPQVEVEVDPEIVANEQKSVDAGSSPWKLDPAFVAQVFISLIISPEGITGDYPVGYEDMQVVKNTGTDAIVQVNDEDSPVKRVYLKRLIRQDSTGIWTVVGYDPKESE